MSSEARVVGKVAEVEHHSNKIKKDNVVNIVKVQKENGIQKRFKYYYKKSNKNS